MRHPEGREMEPKDLLRNCFWVQRNYGITWNITVGANAYIGPTRFTNRACWYYGKTRRFLVGTPLPRRPEGQRIDIMKGVGKTNVKCGSLSAGATVETKVVVSDTSGEVSLRT